MPKSPAFKIVLPLFVLLFLVISQSSCLLFGTMNEVAREEPVPNQTSKRQNPDANQSSKIAKPKTGETIRNDRPFAELEREILADLKSENFDAIDQKANKARRDRERFPGGYWKLKIIYEPLTQIYTDETVTDEMWKAHLERLKRWKEKSPKSITARVALGQSYIGYAWFVRGSGFVGTVKDKDWDVVGERLELARKELDEAKDLPEKCPQRYESLLFLAMAQGWEDEDYDRLFEEAVNFEPNYYYFYYDKGMNSLPRWHGDEGDWEKYAEKLEKLESKEKNIVYFLYVSHMVDRYYDDWRDRKRISWERAKQGYKELEQTFGTDKQRLSQYAFLASVNEDMPEAYNAFKKIGDDWDDEVWSEKRFYEVKNWAVARYEAENGK